MKVIVFINGIPKLMEEREYRFEEIVPHKSFTLTSTNKDGNETKIYGPKDKVRIEEGMKINMDLTING